MNPLARTALVLATVIAARPEQLVKRGYRTATRLAMPYVITMVFLVTSMIFALVAGYFLLARTMPPDGAAGTIAGVFLVAAAVIYWATFVRRRR